MHWESRNSRMQWNERREYWRQKGSDRQWIDVDGKTRSQVKAVMKKLLGNLGSCNPFKEYGEKDSKMYVLWTGSIMRASSLCGDEYRGWGKGTLGGEHCSQKTWVIKRKSQCQAWVISLWVLGQRGSRAPKKYRLLPFLWVNHNNWTVRPYCWTYHTLWF